MNASSQLHEAKVNIEHHLSEIHSSLP